MNLGHGEIAQLQISEAVEVPIPRHGGMNFWVGRDRFLLATGENWRIRPLFKGTISRGNTPEPTTSFFPGDIRWFSGGYLFGPGASCEGSGEEKKIGIPDSHWNHFALKKALKSNSPSG